MKINTYFFQHYVYHATEEKLNFSIESDYIWTPTAAAAAAAAAAVTTAPGPSGSSLPGTLAVGNYARIT